MKTIPEARSQKPEVGSRKPEVGNPSSVFCPLPSGVRLPASQRGVALIITLILLAVVTFMALTFLAVSRRERGAVTTTTDTTSARLAADAALAAAEGEIVANTLAATNPYNFGLLVSTNYLRTNSSPLPDDLTNLFINPRTPVWLSNTVTRAMENRFYLDLNRNGEDDPNGWVTNVDNTGAIITDGSGNPSTNIVVGDPEWIGVLQHPDQPYGPNNPFVARYAYIALPIGNALDLNAIYDDAMGIYQTASMSPGNDGFMRNEGVGSWEINLAAFLADLNINQWDTIANPYTYREPGSAIPNTGAAFDDALSLLSYRYDYFYNGSYNLASVNKLFGGAGSAASVAFRNDNIDGYSDGPLQTGFPLPGDITTPQQNDKPSLPWSGADNTNQFFDLQELFNTNETAVGVAPALVAAGNDFTGRLLNAGTNFSTYDRYTYYRLASQLGVESAPEQDKMNLNYDNLDPGANGVLTANGTASATNFVPWQPLTFFTNAADRMLRDYSQEWLVENPSNYVATFNLTTNIGTLAFPTNMPVPFGISSIPVWVSNQFVYTPAVQRVLQLAANIYDATTNNTAVMGANFPSVFRPTFLVTRDPVSGYTNVYINGYEQVVSVVGTGDFQLNLPVNVSDLLTPPSYGFGVWTNVNVYGVPWIIGAKKGFPNFNEFSMQGIVQVTRKLEIVRPTLAALPSDLTTNQMYILSVSNVFGVECWNSYSSNHSDSVLVWARDTNSMTLTNDSGMLTLSSAFLTANVTNVPAQWPGTSQPWSQNSNPNFPSSNSFVIPLFTNVVLFTNLTYVYSAAPPQFEYTTAYPDVGIQPLPQFGLLTTNRLQVVMLDQDVNGNYDVIDYVHFAGPDSRRNLNAELADVDPNGLGLWNTNLLGTVPSGVVNQINYSDNPIQNKANTLTTSDDGTWINPQGGGSVGDAIAGFDSFLNQVINGSLRGMGTDPNTRKVSYTTNLNVTVQVPFTPTRTVFNYTTWQANDPLVHYLASDLSYFGNDYNGLQTGTNQWNKTSSAYPVLSDLGQMNKRYQPWGVSSQMSQVAGVDANGSNLAFKDPLIYSSDDWDFPTYKLPTVGWLGRVHRGTPWQTVFLKSANVLAENGVGLNTWMVWTGNGNAFDATNTAPVQDRLLFDNFTTAFDDNATRGQLSVNVGASDPSNPQAGLAAWSALFSGVQALTNTANNGSLPNGALYFPRPSLQITNFPINPAGPGGAGSALGQIVTSINSTRTNAALFPLQAFEHAGDVLAAPALTVQSPFVNWNDPSQQQNGISDEMYEWLPQQVMSLLRVSGTPQSPMRYVIYSYGQALKPAPNGIYTGSGPLFGMITNYQVVAESATRSVVRFNGTRANNPYQFYDSSDLIWTNVPSITNNNVLIERFNVLPPN